MPFYDSMMEMMKPIFIYLVFLSLLLYLKRLEQDLTPYDSNPILSSFFFSPPFLRRAQCPQRIYRWLIICLDIENELNETLRQAKSGEYCHKK